MTEEAKEWFIPKDCARALGGVLDNQRNRLTDAHWLELLQAVKEEINDRILAMASGAGCEAAQVAQGSSPESTPPDSVA